MNEKEKSLFLLFDLQRGGKVNMHVFTFMLSCIFDIFHFFCLFVKIKKHVFIVFL
jgi:hypothetical protein